MMTSYKILLCITVPLVTHNKGAAVAISAVSDFGPALKNLLCNLFTFVETKVSSRGLSITKKTNISSNIIELHKIRNVWPDLQAIQAKPTYFRMPNNCVWIWLHKNGKDYL